MEVGILFFFSSRRRHTRYWRDWSSDVCSSDLPDLAVAALADRDLQDALVPHPPGDADVAAAGLEALPGLGGGEPDALLQLLRSEERRVGKEWRSRGSPVNLKKKCSNSRNSHIY